MIQLVLSNKDLQMELKQSGIEKAAKFSWNKVASNTINIYVN
jgi:glycosyltransferase involved in cell wall biosynthesis